MSIPRPSPGPLAPLTTLTVRSPVDALAAVPIMLGFHPSDSLVMMTFGGARGVNARIDLPAAGTTDHDLGLLAELLLGPAIAQHADAALFVFYSDDRLTCRRIHRILTSACRRSGIRILHTLRVDDGCWWAIGAPASAPGHPYLVDSHPFLAEAVVAGKVTLDSRAAVAARVAPDPEGAARVDAVGPVGSLLDIEEVRALVEGRSGVRGLLDDDEAAWLIASVADPEVRDSCWWRLTPGEAQDRLDLWCDLLRRTPECDLFYVAGVTAMLAWLTGDGALAWCAIDRSDAQGLPAQHSLVGLVRIMLERGAPPPGPEDWDALEGLAC